MIVNRDSLTPFQALSEKILLLILAEYDSRILSEPAFKLVIQTLIRHYPEFDMDNRKYYNKTQYYKRYFRFSKRAWTQYRTDPGKVMYEHLWPIDAIFEALLQVKARSAKLDLQAVHEVMKESEVIILSDEEANVLNGSPSQLYQIDGHSRRGAGLKSSGRPSQRLAAIGAEIEPATENNHVWAR